jgi:hypothetical protein
VQKVTIAPVCYINKPLDPNMKCAMHNRGCGAYLQVGDICYIDGSECTFIDGHYFISVRLLNHLIIFANDQRISAKVASEN